MSKEQLRTISYEIRTPLNGILAMTDMLIKMKITEDVRENVNIIDLSAREILKVITKIDKIIAENGNNEPNIGNNKSSDGNDNFLEKVISSSEKPTKTSSEQDMNNKMGFQVLVVEDDHINQIIMEKLLKNAGHQVTIAENGQEALWQAKNNHFDIIFMDMMMPVMSGAAASMEIRKAEQEQNKARTPIIAITANASLEAKNECIAAGMDDYVTKPVRTKTILEIIEHYLNPSK